MQSADISWHGLEGLDDSIMDTVAALSFGGDFGAAHSYMDFGGDILGVTQWNTSFANGWYLLTRVTVQYKHAYRDALRGGPVSLSNSQAGPGRNFTQPS